MTPEQKLRMGFDSLYDNHPFISSILARWDVRPARTLPGQMPDPNRPFVIATDGLRLLYNPDEIGEMLIGDVSWLLLHEAGHVFLGHHLRAGQRHPVLWNIACDLALNDLIRSHIPRGSVVLARCLFPDNPEFGFAPNKSAEFYYTALLQKFQDEQPEPQPQPSPQGDADDDETEENDSSETGQSGSSDDKGDNEDADSNSSDESAEDSDSDASAGEGGAADSREHGTTGMGTASDSSGAGDDSDGGHSDGESHAPGDSGENAKSGQSLDDWAEGLPDPTGDVIEPTDLSEARKRGQGEFERELDELEGHWQHCVAQGVAASNACGNTPAWLAQQMEKMFGHKPEHDAKNLLKRFMTLAYRARYTFDRPNRRSAYRRDVVMPAKHSRGGGKGLVIVDTSGSMSTQECETAFSWIEDVVREFPGAKIVLAQCDTRLIPESVQEFDRYDFPIQVPPTWWGRGGTNLRPAFEWVKQNPDSYKWIAVISDMEWTYGYSPDPGVPTIWMSTRYKPDRLPYGQLPFGLCIGPTMEQYQ